MMFESPIEIAAEVFVRAFQGYFRLVAILLEPVLDKFGLKLSPAIRKLLRDESAPLDERIAKIDAARVNLVEGLTAIDELKAEAERNKKEAEVTRLRIEELQGQHLTVEKQLSELKKLANVDSSNLKELIGLGGSQVFRERLYGFFSGVFASIVASLLVLGGAYLWQKWHLT